MSRSQTELGNQIFNTEELFFFSLLTSFDDGNLRKTSLIFAFQFSMHKQKRNSRFDSLTKILRFIKIPTLHILNQFFMHKYLLPLRRFFLSPRKWYVNMVAQINFLNKRSNVLKRRRKKLCRRCDSLIGDKPALSQILIPC